MHILCYNQEIMPSSILAIGHHVPGILLAFPSWYLLGQPARMLRGYAAYAHALLEILSVPYLLLSLLSPWKGIVEPPHAHWTPSTLVYGLVLNVTSRAVGFVIRTVAIVVAIVLHLGLIVGTVVLLVVWLLLPFLVCIAFVVLAVALPG
jgi:hypothetical protein